MSATTKRRPAVQITTEPKRHAACRVAGLPATGPRTGEGARGRRPFSAAIRMPIPSFGNVLRSNGVSLRWTTDRGAFAAFTAPDKRVRACNRIGEIHPDRGVSTQTRFVHGYVRYGCYDHFTSNNAFVTGMKI